MQMPLKSIKNKQKLTIKKLKRGQNRRTEKVIPIYLYVDVDR